MSEQTLEVLSAKDSELSLSEKIKQKVRNLRVEAQSVIDDEIAAAHAAWAKFIELHQSVIRELNRLGVVEFNTDAGGTLIRQNPNGPPTRQGEQFDSLSVSWHIDGNGDFHRNQLRVAGCYMVTLDASVNGWAVKDSEVEDGDDKMVDVYHYRLTIEGHFSPTVKAHFQSLEQLEANLLRICSEQLVLEWDAETRTNHPLLNYVPPKLQ